MLCGPCSRFLGRPVLILKYARKCQPQEKFEEICGEPSWEISATTTVDDTSSSSSSSIATTTAATDTEISNTLTDGTAGAVSSATQSQLLQHPQQQLQPQHQQ